MRSINLIRLFLVLSIFLCATQQCARAEERVGCGAVNVVGTAPGSACYVRRKLIAAKAPKKKATEIHPGTARSDESAGGKWLREYVTDYIPNFAAILTYALVSLLTLSSFTDSQITNAGLMLLCANSAAMVMRARHFFRWANGAPPRQWLAFVPILVAPYLVALACDGLRKAGVTLNLGLLDASVFASMRGAGLTDFGAFLCGIGLGMVLVESLLLLYTLAATVGGALSLLACPFGLLLVSAKHTGTLARRYFRFLCYLAPGWCALWLAVAAHAAIGFSDCGAWQKVLGACFVLPAGLYVCTIVFREMFSPCTSAKESASAESAE